MTEQAEREALLPCPWCNSPGMLREIGKGPQAFRVECSDGCCAMEIWHEDDPDGANRAWNTRASSPTYAAGWSAAVEAAAKVIDGFAERCSAQQAACKTEEGRAEMGTMARSRRDMATAIRALALPAAATDGDAVIELVAESVHDAYLETARRLTWPINPANDVPYADLPWDAKELDRATAHAALSALGIGRV